MTQLEGLWLRESQSSTLSSKHAFVPLFTDYGKKIQEQTPQKRNNTYLFTASHSYDAEETVYLIGATVIRYLK